MTQPYMFEKPLGLRDTLPATQQVISHLKEIFHKDLKAWGYDFIKTPALEYAETIGRASAIDDGQLFKFLDGEGHPVVLRPDMTTPIARVAASGLKRQPLPLRLAYTAALYRSQQKEGGHPSEFEQTGAELIGDATPFADAEVIALMMTLLRRSGLESIRIAIGHVGIVNTLLFNIVKDKARAEQLRKLLYGKNDVGFRDYAASLNLPAESLERLNRFIDSRRMSNEETLNYLKTALPDSENAQPYYQHITELMRLLSYYNLIEEIDLDITLVPHLDYYTGFVFEGYGGRLGFTIASGGRYDGLLAKFNRPCPATGFGIRLDRLMEASGQNQHAAENDKSAVIYEHEMAAEAIRYAMGERKKGRDVVLQNADGIEDMEAFVGQFKSVVPFLKTKGVTR